jgi:hypothetical protein
MRLEDWRAPFERKLFTYINLPHFLRQCINVYRIPDTSAPFFKLQYLVEDAFPKNIP